MLLGRNETENRDVVAFLKAQPQWQKIKNFKIHQPKEYGHFEALKLWLVGCDLSHQQAIRLGDYAASKTGIMAHNFLRDGNFPFPVYWLNAGLAEALLKTDLPPDVIGLKRIIPRAAVMLPLGFLNNPDGLEVEWLVFEHWLRGESFSFPEANGRRLSVDFDLLGVGTCVAADCRYYSSCDLSRRGEGGFPFRDKTFYTEGEKESAIDVESEREFTNSLLKLALHVLLFLQQPSSVSEEAVVPSGTGFKKQPSSASVLNPRWIGRGYQPKTQKSAGGGTHASPQAHWRRGHWRMQAVGSRKNLQHKPVWIEPVWVN